ncbi:hypothetical protein QR680_013229 [Steinernema hermaphroditum]|uniref:JmjC domain-containing protein n=1 Tax=Steinernema hermaphroditum TaxID=289476 RepID=A0AA39I4S2_9BILA|nr:hypothetical protein QR680_013229 [Steinernema hermaphroditum]
MADSELGSEEVVEILRDVVEQLPGDVSSFTGVRVPQPQEVQDLLLEKKDGKKPPDDGEMLRRLKQVKEQMERSAIALSGGSVSLASTSTQTPLQPKSNQSHVPRFDGTLRMEIRNISTANETVRGVYRIFKDVPWRIVATFSSKDGHRSIGAFLQASPELASSNSGKSWSVDAQAELRLINRNPKLNMVRKTHHVYTQNEDDWGYSSFVSFKDICDESKGFYNTAHDSIIYEISVKVLKTTNVLRTVELLKRIDDLKRIADMQRDRGHLDKALDANWSAIKLCKDRTSLKHKELDIQKKSIIYKKVRESIQRIETGKDKEGDNCTFGHPAVKRAFGHTHHHSAVGVRGTQKAASSATRQQMQLKHQLRSDSAPPKSSPPPTYATTSIRGSTQSLNSPIPREADSTDCCEAESCCSETSCRNETRVKYALVDTPYDDERQARRHFSADCLKGVAADSRLHSEDSEEESRCPCKCCVYAESSSNGGDSLEELEVEELDLRLGAYDEREQCFADLLSLMTTMREYDEGKTPQKKIMFENVDSLNLYIHNKVASTLRSNVKKAEKLKATGRAGVIKLAENIRAAQKQISEIVEKLDEEKCRAKKVEQSFHDTTRKLKADLEDKKCEMVKANEAYQQKLCTLKKIDSQIRSERKQNEEAIVCILEHAEEAEFVALRTLHETDVEKFLAVKHKCMKQLEKIKESLKSSVLPHVMYIRQRNYDRLKSCVQECDTGIQKLQETLESRMKALQSGKTLGQLGNFTSEWAPAVPELLREPSRASTVENVRVCPYGPIGSKSSNRRPQSSCTSRRFTDRLSADDPIVIVPGSSTRQPHWPVIPTDVWSPYSPLPDGMLRERALRRSIDRTFPTTSSGPLPWSTPTYLNASMYPKVTRNIEDSIYLTEPLIRTQSSALLEEFERTMPHLVISMATRRSTRQKSSRSQDEGDDDIFNKSDLMRRYYEDISKFCKDAKYANPDMYITLNPLDFTVEYIRKNGFDTPIYFNGPAKNLGMKLPDPETFTVNDVVKLVGSEKNIDVIEVHQQAGRHMTLEKFVNYYNDPDRLKLGLYNVLSLEFSLTKLEEVVQCPQIVKDIGWVEKYWPEEFRERQKLSLQLGRTDYYGYPKVQYYCLMSVATCFTDFHIDFGGTSVWYHILKGKKVFWLVEPTKQNLYMYEEWVRGGHSSFFGTVVEKCARVELHAGDTFMIPSGWIHCVYTPEDSLVFGGNFMHSWSIDMQLRIPKLERTLKISKKYRYPLYGETLWYVASGFVREATGKKHVGELPIVVPEEKNIVKVEKAEDDDEEERDDTDTSRGDTSLSESRKTVENDESCPSDNGTPIKHEETQSDMELTMTKEELELKSSNEDPVKCEIDTEVFKTEEDLVWAETHNTVPALPEAHESQPSPSKEEIGCKIGCPSPTEIVEPSAKRLKPSYKEDDEDTVYVYDDDGTSKLIVKLNASSESASLDSVPGTPVSRPLSRNNSFVSLMDAPLDAYTFDEEYLMGLSACERKGLRALADHLQKLLKRKKQELAEGIENPKELLRDFYACLRKTDELNPCEDITNNDGDDGMPSLQPESDDKPRFPEDKASKKTKSPKTPASKKGQKKKSLPSKTKSPRHMKPKKEEIIPDIIDGMPRPTQTVAKANPYGYDPLANVSALGHAPLQSAFRRTANMAKPPPTQKFINANLNKFHSDLPHVAPLVAGTAKAISPASGSTTPSSLAPRTPTTSTPVLKTGRVFDPATGMTDLFHSTPSTSGPIEQFSPKLTPVTPDSETSKSRVRRRFSDASEPAAHRIAPPKKFSTEIDKTLAPPKLVSDISLVSPTQKVNPFEVIKQAMGYKEPKECDLRELNTGMPFVLEHFPQESPKKQLDINKNRNSFLSTPVDGVASDPVELSRLLADAVVQYDRFPSNIMKVGREQRPKGMPKTAALVVVGDVGHSPRMNYHAISLAEHGMNVEIVGYMDSNPHQKIRDHPRIRIIPLRPPPKWFATVKPTVALGLKVVWTAFCLLWALMCQTTWNLSMVMIQNPPGIPGLIVTWVVSKAKGAYFVIDWHNYTWSILRNNYKIPVESLVLPRKDEPTDSSALKTASPEGESTAPPPEPSTSRRSTRDERQMLTGTPRPFSVRLKEKLEKPVEKKKSPASWIHRYIQWAYNWEAKMGRAANLNICVTKEMRGDLAGAWGIRAVTLYDKAPSWNFKELSVDEKHVFFEKLCRSNEFKTFRAEEVFPSDEREVLESAVEGKQIAVTRLSYRDAAGVAHLRTSRPFILLSSTSWTEDEDFGILLDALKAVESVASISSTAESAPPNRIPHFCVVITGKGPQKAMYLDRITRFKFRHIDVITPWLDAEDYPKMLATADLGVSLHTSTSGIDLPMKVVDMFGCKLPVLAKSFRAIHELVVERENESSSSQQASPNGRLFDSSGELKSHILDLATGFPLHSQKLLELRVNLRREKVSWSDHWDAVVGPILGDQWHGSSLRRFSTCEVAGVAHCFAGSDAFLPIRNENNNDRGKRGHLRKYIDGQSVAMRKSQVVMKRCESFSDWAEEIEHRGSCPSTRNTHQVRGVGDKGRRDRESTEEDLEQRAEAMDQKKTAAGRFLGEASRLPAATPVSVIAMVPTPVCSEMDCLAPIVADSAPNSSPPLSNDSALHSPNFDHDDAPSSPHCASLKRFASSEEPCSDDGICMESPPHKQTALEQHLSSALQNLQKEEGANPTPVSGNYRTELKRPDLKGSFRCSICQKIFCHSSSLSRHRMQAHFKSYTCTLCRKEITTYSSVVLRRAVLLRSGNGLDGDPESADAPLRSKTVAFFFWSRLLCGTSSCDSPSSSVSVEVSPKYTALCKSAPLTSSSAAPRDGFAATETSGGEIESQTKRPKEGEAASGQYSMGLFAELGATQGFEVSLPPSSSQSGSFGAPLDSQLAAPFR